MKKLIKYITFTLILVFTVDSYSQSIYKGLTYGMTKTEAKKEFKKNKDLYTTVDIGNGFLYRIYRQNFSYDNGKLVGVLLSPKGAMLGQSYDNAKSYLINTRSFFERLGYETFIDNEWWNAPLNYVKSGSKWGLALNKQDKSTIVQIYTQSLSSTTYLVNLKIWHYDTWMGYYDAETETQQTKADESGF
tara:strand:- start:46 stop:612 length:567 start_codon:yes stop_codon:yes gene_type:complete